jgi:hypothetical protein
MRHFSIALALVLLLVATGCSVASPAAVAPSSPNYAGESGKQSGAATSAPAPRPAAAVAPEPNAQGGAAATGWDRYVIRNGEAYLTVKDVEAAAGEVTRIATEAGGFVSGSNVRRDNTRVFAELVIQVPAEAFDRVVGELKSLATVVESVRTTTQDVTEEYVDNEATLANLRASEDSTRRLLSQTGKMEDIVVVQRELTRIRGEIEKIEGRQRFLKRRVDMSTINVHLATEAPVSLASARSGWQPLRTAATAWEGSLTFLSGMLDSLIAVFIFFWWAIPLIVVALYLLRRRRRPRRPSPLLPPSASGG